ncbi:hypothetical protein MJ563_17690 [Klebsiella pneumoniae]|nr:hypothetical protein MJ563_17690 [Klebsiella pneumoniae]
MWRKLVDITMSQNQITYDGADVFDLRAVTVQDGALPAWPDAAGGSSPI